MGLLEGYLFDYRTDGNSSDSSAVFVFLHLTSMPRVKLPFQMMETLQYAQLQNEISARPPYVETSNGVQCRPSQFKFRTNRQRLSNRFRTSNKDTSFAVQLPEYFVSDGRKYIVRTLNMIVTDLVDRTGAKVPQFLRWMCRKQRSDLWVEPARTKDFWPCTKIFRVKPYGSSDKWGTLIIWGKTCCFLVEMNSQKRGKVRKINPWPKPSNPNRQTSK